VKYTTKQPEVAKQSGGIVITVSITDTRCGGCMFFISKLDPNNPYDGFCHAYPPTPIPTGFRWAKTASNEFGCSFFRKRG